MGRRRHATARARTCRASSVDPAEEINITLAQPLYLTDRQRRSEPHLRAMQTHAFAHTRTVWTPTANHHRQSQTALKGNESRNGNPGQRPMRPIAGRGTKPSVCPLLIELQILRREHDRRAARGEERLLPYRSSKAKKGGTSAKGEA